MATVVATGGVGAALLVWFPSLHATAPNAFSTITGVATLYGVAFAIIEVVRLNDVASEQTKSVEAATARVEAAMSVRDLLSCKETIAGAMRSIDETNYVPTAIIARLVDLYSAEYAVQARDEGSEHRRMLLQLEAYAMIAKPNGAPSTRKLREALLAMLRHVSVDLAARTGEVTR